MSAAERDGHRRRPRAGIGRAAQRAALLLTALHGAGLMAGAAQADDGEGWRTSGMIAAELRGFAEGPSYPGQADGGQGSWIFSPRLERESASGRQQVTVVPFLRWDGRDGRRTHADLREAYWRRLWDSWELTAGIDRVFWGVTESRHLVDVINQTDLVEDIDGEDKLGQPMVQVATDRVWGRLEAFALPGFRERTFPGRSGRLRTPLPVDDDALYESGAGRRRIDTALRWSHYVGDWDLGVSLFDGTDREPRLAADPAGTRLIPFYAVIRQAGVDIQYTRDAWLWKLEAIARGGQGETFGAAVAGFEYTFYQVGRSAADIGLLAEYLYDGRDEGAPPTIHDDDVFVGARLALNDAFDTQVLGGAVVDRNDGSVAGFVEAERRVGNRIKVELEWRWFTDVDPGNNLATLQRDSHLTLRVSRFF